MGLAHAARSRRGNIALIVALAAVVLLGVGAIVLDIGYGRVVQLQLEHTSEAAAHAGSLKLDGTDAGIDAAREAALEIAAANRAGGRVLSLDANEDNDAAGDVVIGTWEDDEFTPTTDPTLANSVQVRARVPDLALFISPVAVGVSSAPVSAQTRMLAITGGAGAVDCYIPLGVASCLVSRYTVDGLADITLKLNPAGIDNVGWARGNGSPNASWSRDQIANCRQGGEVEIGDPVGLQNGVVTSAMSELVTAVSNSSTRWDTSKWGTLPARLSNSSIPTNKYGRTYEGVVLVFDGGTQYCSGSGGPFNQSKPLAGFLWGAIYDVANSGSSSSRTIKLRLDTRNDHNVGTGAGGPDYGVVTHLPPRMVPS